jgi:hypothetical protein
MEIPVSVSVFHFPETNLEVFSVFLSIEIKHRKKSGYKGGLTVN